MNKAPLFLSESIRTNSSDKLTRNFSLNKIYNSLIDLFIDRTAINTSYNLFETNKDEIEKSMRYNHCNRINDARRIEFGNNFKQESDVFDEKRQIWIDKHIDVERDDLFIPRDDA